MQEHHHGGNIHGLNPRHAEWRLDGQNLGTTDSVEDTVYETMKVGQQVQK